jgi:hypothetical protein
MFEKTIVKFIATHRKHVGANYGGYQLSKGWKWSPINREMYQSLVRESIGGHLVDVLAQGAQHTSLKAKIDSTFNILIRVSKHFITKSKIAYHHVI